jgi:hypothetical protein
LIFSSIESFFIASAVKLWRISSLVRFIISSDGQGNGNISGFAANVLASRFINSDTYNKRYGTGNFICVIIVVVVVVRKLRFGVGLRSDLPWT